MAERDDRDRQQASPVRARDRSIALVILGTILLTPPLGRIFQIDAKLWGMPAVLIYLFTVWILLILGARALSGPLSRGDREGRDAGPGGDP